LFPLSFCDVIVSRYQSNETAQLTRRNAFTSGIIKNKIRFVCCAAAEMGAAGRIDITSLIPHRSPVCIPLGNRKAHLISVKFPRKSWLFIDFLTYDMV
jgi:hypothetical protein